MNATNKTTMFDRCSSTFGYQELASSPNGKALTACYMDVFNLIKAYYDQPVDMTEVFQGPDKKWCWYRDTVDFAKYQLSWFDAARALYSVYDDCPLAFFLNTHKAGGSPDRGYITPTLDAECRRGDFVKFYASKIEDRIHSTVDIIPKTKSDREKAYIIFESFISNMIVYDHQKGNCGFVDIPSHSILGFVRNNAAVCEGFAKSYMAMMNYAGIRTICVCGYSYSTGKPVKHACNFVYLSDEKKWIAVDVTIGVNSKGKNGFNLDMSSGDFIPYPPEEIRGFGEPYIHQPTYRDIWAKLR